MKISTKITVACALLAITALAGCKGAAPAASNGGGLSGEEPSLTVVAALPTALPTPTETATMTPTATSMPPTVTPTPTITPSPTATSTPTATPLPPHPLQIEFMRQQSYPGSAITFEQTPEQGANYQRHIVSYKSEGYKIYALLTVPADQKPATGWPVVIFNHGYIPPAQYRTTERYVAYVDAFARNGYIVLKSDYRGHGSSEGPAAGGYGSPAYTVDILNALASIKTFKDADPNRIGMWGHSMGGQVTLRAMVVAKDIRAGVIWGGVVANYPDIVSKWTRPNAPAVTVTVTPFSARRGWRQDLTDVYGSPERNPQFWASISPNSYLKDLSGPLQLHHSVTDEEVPVAFSESLNEQMKAAGEPCELFTYPGDNHNINANFAIAMQRSIAFMDLNVKNR